MSFLVRNRGSITALAGIVVLIVGGFGLPTLIGAAFGDPIAGLLWGGFLRLAEDGR